MRTAVFRFGAIWLAIVCLTGVVAPAAVAQDAAKPYRIYMVLWRGWEDASQGFKDYLTQERLPFELIVRDADRDKEKLPGFVQEAKTLSVDLVVTWGTSVSLGMLGASESVDPEKHITLLPALFMIVSQPVGSGLVPNLKSSGRNITGTLYLVPEETQLKAARSYLAFDRLGVVYNPGEQNSLINVENLRRLSRTDRFELIERQIPNDGSGDPSADAIGDLVASLAEFKPILLYQGPDSFLNVHRDLLTGAALDHGIPVLAAGENPVRRSNALLGVINRYYSVGQLTAMKAVEILVEKTEPSKIPIESPKRFSYVINMRVAKALKLYPTMNILKFAEIIE